MKSGGYLLLLALSIVTGTDCCFRRSRGGRCDGVTPITEKLYCLDQTTKIALIETNKLPFSCPDPFAQQPATAVQLKRTLGDYGPGTNVDPTIKEQHANDFLRTVMATEVMLELEKYLQQNGYPGLNLQLQLKEAWFTTYQRQNKPDSSAFEHVLKGEIIKNKVTGFHNWISFCMEEDFLSDITKKKELPLTNEMSVLDMAFRWHNKKKPCSSVLVGITPELEMAIYTYCFLTQGGQSCPVQISGKTFSVKAIDKNIPGKKVLNTVFPVIETSCDQD